MLSLKSFSNKPETIPTATSWYLADLGEFRGRQELFTKQSSQKLKLGFEVGRFVSLERLIEQNKSRYYETLEQSSQGWHEGKNDPWPYVNYILFILKTAYKEFEDRVGEIASHKGAKTELVPMTHGDIKSDACYSF